MTSFWNGRKNASSFGDFCILWKRLGFATGNSTFVKLAKFSTIRGSSFNDLPFRIRESQNLINIRNHHDHNCFELCLTAAYSLKHGIDLLLTDQQKANPAAGLAQRDTYTAASAHKAQGTFHLPISFASIGNFGTTQRCAVKCVPVPKGRLVAYVYIKTTKQG